ncbi:MAG: LacI family DNA-binding transcriptional regulator [Anaerolineaceae bacterium]|jgi:LacI family transcriptional regulator
MTTIRDVAKHAKVSVTAVSYALNNNGTISDETRQRILQAAKELYYYPNAFARHLKKRKTLTIGVFITSFGGQFYEEILEGIHQTVLKTEYELIVCPQARSLRKMLTQRQVDGAIIFDYKVTSEILLELVSPSFPIVILDRLLEHECILPLLLDNACGMREVFAHLYQQGFRKLVFIAGAVDSLDNTERKQTFLAEADQHGLSMVVYQGNFTRISGYDIGRIMIEKKDLPEAVVCANDQMAIGFIEAMKENGLRAPQDIAVVGFDDILIARHMQPSLSTVGAPRLEWGAQAALQLIHFLEEGKPFEQVRIPTHLIIRQSSLRS